MKNYLIPLLLACCFLEVARAQEPAAPTTEAPTESSPSSETEQSPENSSNQRPLRPPADAPRPATPLGENANMQLLVDYLPKDAMHWLEAKGEPFLALWQKDRSGYPKGALLIIHAEGEHLAWPQTTLPLHETLPDYGWATLSVSLPLPDKRLTPDRTFPVKARPLAETTPEQEAESPSQEGAEAEGKNTENNDIPTPPPKTTAVLAETIAEERLVAALTFLHDQGQFNVTMMGSGYGAIRAHEFLLKIMPKVTDPRLKEQLEKPFRAMIMVNARNQLPIMDAPYENWFFDTELPVLDLYLETDLRNHPQAIARKRLARQKRVAVYKQVKMNVISHEKSWGENRLSRRIRSFLDDNAVGVEVKNAKVTRH